MKHHLALIAALALLVACAPLPLSENRSAIARQSPNFDQRQPNFVIIHHTSSDSAEKALKTLTDPERKVSAHYLIARDGVLYQLVDERLRAWHAGQSYWGGNTDLNSSSIGIELDNDGEETFSDVQINRLLELLVELRERYRIPPANILGHGDIAPRRKNDPSHLFPWKTLAKQGFGLWCDKPPTEPPQNVDTLTALQALGYETINNEAATRAFRRHFLNDDSATELSSADKALLYCLLQAKAGRVLE